MGGINFTNAISDVDMTWNEMKWKGDSKAKTQYNCF